MKRQYSAVCLSLLLASCVVEESQPTVNTGVTAPTVVTAPIAMDAQAPAIAVASIASVQMSQDCPDPNTKPQADMQSAAEPAPGQSARLAKGSGTFTQPCAQSTVQIAFMGKGTASAAVRIGGVRLKSADGKELATLTARLPSLWKDTGYESWDGVLGADSDHKASYKLSIPEWSALEKALGRSSFGQMYTLEIDVDIGGVISTITSPQFERAQTIMIQT